MIISASRRTDIPAFYGRWLINRLREGFVYVRNPFNHRQVSKIILSPDVVDCIIFWTKNPVPFFPYLQEIDDLGYSYYFQFTLTPYDDRIEKNLPSKESLVDAFVKLAELIGSQRVIWRYDPILLAEDISPSYHQKHFLDLASKLRGSTERCIISFLDLYARTKRNTKSLKLQTITEEHMKLLGGFLASIGADYNLELFTCAEAIDLSALGIKKGKCVDAELIESITKSTLQVRKDKNQRKECGCVESVDIGAYNSCAHNCLYCYANDSLSTTTARISTHRPSSPFLLGELKDEDLITMRGYRTQLVKE